jgi:hypothetical protein
MTEKKKTEGSQQKAQSSQQQAATPAQPKPAPKATAPKVKSVPTSEEITGMGLYGIKAVAGSLNIKAIPIPGKRVLIVLPGSSKLIDNLSIVKTGEVYSL